ncbi:MAG: M16 family metallopeptidase [Actinomycetota bacterium]
MSRLVSERPLPGPARPYRFPSFTRTSQDCGLQVIACHLPGRRLCSARLLLDAGAEHAAPGESGVATLAAWALTEGTERYDAESFAQASERLGAGISIDASWDFLQARLSVPASRLEPALDLLAEAVRRPTFPSREVERLRSERLNEIRQEYAEPNRRANLALLEAVYTADSAYARPAGGTISTVAGLDRENLERFYRRFATPGAASFVLAGDLEGVEVEAMVESLFGDWNASEAPRPVPKVEEDLTETAVTLVHRPGSVQSQILLGHMGTPRLIPDFLPVSLMVSVLGGLFTSRLNLKLREEKGYTYGARAWFDFRHQAGPFGASAAVQTDATVDATADAIEEIRRLRAHGVSDEELKEARDYLVGVFPISFETPGAISSAIAHLIVYGLPDDHYHAYRGAMEQVSVEEVGAAANQRLRPDRIAIVVVGDAELLETRLKEASFGPVRVVTDP